MKKLHLRNIIKEVLKEEVGYSRYAPGGKTDGLTKDTLDKILLRIANGDIEVTEDDDDQVARGNKVLDKADPENVARILRGEDPVYNEEVDRMQELAGLKSEIRVNNPNPIKFEDLEDGKVYNFTYNDDTGRGEENDDLKVAFKDSSDNGEFIIVNHLDFPNGEDSFELYPDDVTSIRRV